jgi:hypothetical protein
LTPFALDSKDQFRAPGPDALDSTEYAAEFNEVKAIGSLTSTLRTADQTPPRTSGSKRHRSAGTAWPGP